MRVNSELYQLLSLASINCDQATINSLVVGDELIAKLDEYQLLFSILDETVFVISSNVIKGINNSANSSKVLNTLSSALPFYTQMDLNLYLCPLSNDVCENIELEDGHMQILSDVNAKANNIATSFLNDQEYFNLKLELKIDTSKYSLELMQDMVSQFCSLNDYLKDKYLHSY